MRFVLILAVATVAAAQTLEYRVLKENLLRDHLRLAHPKNPERYRRLKSLFDDAGCRGEALCEQPVKGSKEPNLICGISGTGENPRKIIVAAHFDTSSGDGVIDNWSGAILLPALSENLRALPRRHDFEFVGFAAEERGLLGSRAYLKSLGKEERKQIAAVIVMDCLGLTSTKWWPNGSTRELGVAALTVARALKLSFQGVNIDAVGMTDSVVFKEANIPVLSLHSVTQETVSIVNSHEDVWRAVSWQDYYDSHRLISVLLAHLDRILP